ncbi:MAG: ABC transporter permease [Acidobacteria bacterium]|nr:ABC transporter permease [Acidobacteriota bacterium]
MATSSIRIQAPHLQPPKLMAICTKEAKYEFLKCLRLPMYLVSSLLLPLMFYVLFGLIMGRQMIGNTSMALYLIPTYGTFGVMGASLFGTAANLATERGFGWLEVKRASPMPVFAYFVAKVVLSLIFSLITVLLLLFMGMVFGGVHLATMTALKLIATLVAGSLPFCAMGLAIGYFAGPTSAPAVINLFYLPMSFSSGLWMPYMFLPKFIQHLAVFLPPYHLSQLALNLVGSGLAGSAATHWQSLTGFALVCLGIAWAGHQRDQKIHG